MKNAYLLMTLAVSLGLGFGCGKKSTPSSASSTGNSGSGSGTNGSGSSTDVTSNSTDMTVDGVKLPIVYFDYDQSNLNDEGRTLLQGVATSIKGKTSKLTVEGHCDERGSNEYNLALGERRAQTVKSYLQKLGITADRVNSISYGEERPAMSGSDESVWSKNRRAELVISK